MDPEATGRGSGGEIDVRRLRDPDLRLFEGLDRHLVAGLPCSRSFCMRRRPFPPWRWVGWRWPSCSRFRCGPSRTSCQGGLRSC